MTKIVAPSVCRNFGTNRIQSSAPAPMTKMASSRMTRLRLNPKKLATRASARFVGDAIRASPPAGGGLGSDSMAAWIRYTYVDADLFGAHQIFTRLAARRISVGSAGFVVDSVNAMSIVISVA